MRVHTRADGITHSADAMCEGRRIAQTTERRTQARERHPPRYTAAERHRHARVFLLVVSRLGALTPLISTVATMSFGVNSH